jgi:nicotinate (nicotinamide) nucleotide adenylyltransferase
MTKAREIKRIGIYAGTFDPVHTGHIAFALQSLQVADLDAVYFLPERQPRNKQGVEHFAHRVAMLRRAAQPHPQFHVLELPDVNFSTERTIPRLRHIFPDEQLVFLFGSDIVSNLMNWPKAESLLRHCELVIGVRDQDDVIKIQKQISEWPIQPADLIIFTSFAPHVSSGSIREALRSRTYVKGLLSSVQRYSDHHWLYVSFS